MEQVQARARRTQEKTNAALANSLRIAHEVRIRRRARLCVKRERERERERVTYIHTRVQMM